MGPVEASLVEKYDDIHRRLFPTPKVQEQRRTESELLAKIHDLQVAYASVASRLSTEQKKLEEATKRIEFIEELVKPEFLDENNPPPKLITINAILFLVCKTELASKQDVCGMRRTKDICRIRQLVYYLAGTLTLSSLPQIGRMLGNRDHTPVLHGRNKIAHLRASQPDLDAKLKWYEQALTGTADGSDNASHPAG